MSTMTEKLKANVCKEAMKKKAENATVEINIPNTSAILEPKVHYFRGISVSIAAISSSVGKVVFDAEKDIDDFTDEEIDNLPAEIAKEIKPYAEELGKKIEEILKKKGFVKRI